MEFDVEVRADRDLAPAEREALNLWRRTVFDQPGGKMENDGATMVWACGGAAWPAGEIDLCGLPW